MSDHSNPLCSALFATSAPLLSSPTIALAPEQLLIVDSRKSSLLVAPVSSYCSGDLLNSSMWSNTVDFRYTSPCTTATATATASTATDPSRNTAIKSPTTHRKDEGDDSRRASPEQVSTRTLSVIVPAPLSTAPQLSQCIPAISAISALCSQAQALLASSLSGTGDLCPSMPVLKLTSEEVLARLTCPDGTEESGPGSSGAQISVLSMFGEMYNPLTSSTLATFPPPSLIPPPLDSLHPPAHHQYIQRYPFKSRQQPDLALASYSPTESLFDLIDSSSLSGLIAARMSSNIDCKTTPKDDDNNPNDSCKTASHDAVIAAIQQYLENFPGGEQKSSKQQNTSLEENAEGMVAYPQAAAENPPEEKKSERDGLVRPFQKPSAEANPPPPVATRLSLGTVPALGKLDRDADIKYPNIEDAISIRRPPWHKFIPDEASYVKRDEEYRVHVLSSLTAKRPESCDRATTQIASLYSPERAGRSPRLGPDRRMQHMSEQLDREREQDKGHLSFQDVHSEIHEFSKLQSKPMKRTLKSKATHPEVKAEKQPEGKGIGPSDPARPCQKTLEATAPTITKIGPKLSTIAALGKPHQDTDFFSTSRLKKHLLSGSHTATDLFQMRHPLWHEKGLIV